ncbi:hypothetical protein DXG03_000246 [Asterophora parasitica]|uniref:Uncharacterized protein n=1 Tax=Asterophora parasitica TaxID=117018 RepID=A0A9P7GKZ3_9AGAR|nr:hypothetical protein DXG03_000246 [Asterophora parasitica]
MDNHDIDEDSIDLEALQAQIDMSMSFAQDMISTWVKPSRKLPSRSNIDIEAELKEYMRRPPRLGVGAAIPEGHNTSREVARLKGQLVGKGNKRSRDDGPDAKEKSEDEEESRAGAIKKKARVDPFGDNGKKKKKNKSAQLENSVDAPPKPPVIPETEAEEQEEVFNMVVEGTGEPSTPFITPNTKKRKKKKRHTAVEVFTASAVATESSSTLVSPAPGIKVSDDKHHTPAKKIARVPIDVSFTSTPATPLHIRRQAQSATLLKTPLLNLGHPESDEDSDDDVKSGVPDSPKKKKRRRRKKKNGTNGSTTEAAAEVTDVH